MRVTIRGELTRKINATATGELIGFEIKDEDLIELPTGASWNPVHAVWGKGELPETGSLIEVTGKDWYQKETEYKDINDQQRTKKQWQLRNVTNLVVLHTTKETQTDEGAPF